MPDATVLYPVVFSPSLPFPSLPFPSLLFPSLPFPSIIFPSLPLHSSFLFPCIPYPVRMLSLPTPALCFLASIPAHLSLLTLPISSPARPCPSLSLPTSPAASYLHTDYLIEFSSFPPFVLLLFFLPPSVILRRHLPRKHSLPPSFPLSLPLSFSLTRVTKSLALCFLLHHNHHSVSCLSR